MTRIKLLGIVMVGLALVACGDDEEGNGGETGSDLDDKQLGELTAAEADLLCGDIAASASFSKEDQCELMALTSSFAGGDCEALKEQCISSPDEPEQTDSCDTSKFAGCTATVAEAKACMTALIDNAKALTCASTLQDLAQQPAACAAFNQKCPEYFGNEETGEGP